jgi:hypothetical protein
MSHYPTLSVYDDCFTDAKLQNTGEKLVEIQTPEHKRRLVRRNAWVVVVLYTNNPGIPSDTFMDKYKDKVLFVAEDMRSVVRPTTFQVYHDGTVIKQVEAIEELETLLDSVLTLNEDTQEDGTWWDMFQTLKCGLCL